MSRVNLNTVLLYKGDEQLRPVSSTLALEGIDKLFPSLTFPSKGRTFLYGHRNPALPYLLKAHAGARLHRAVVDVEVEIGVWLRQKVDISDDPESGIKHTRFMSVPRAKVGLLERLDENWKEALAQAGLPKDDTLRGATRYPHLLDEVIELPEFKHLAVISYHVYSEELQGQFQAATVFDLDAIMAVEGGADLQGVTFEV